MECLASLLASPPPPPPPVVSHQSFAVGKLSGAPIKKNTSLLLYSRRGHAIQCIRAAKEEIAFSVTYTGDYMANCIEVREWESGKSLDCIAASQGIKIRRRPPTGFPTQCMDPLDFRLEGGDSRPRNILEKIIWDKDLEVAQFKVGKPLSVLIKAHENAPPIRDFLGTLRASYQRTGVPALIAEVKKASPSRGVLRHDFDPVEIAKSYEKNGAACLSVLTDEKHFQGSFENLQAIRQAGVKCPLLCKEFIIDAWQIHYARSKGADAILLIAAVLPDLDIKYMMNICRKLGLAAIVEVHNEREMDRVLNIDGIQIIGINNRDLETFEVDISNTKKLLEGKRGQKIREKDILVVGESGLFSPEDVKFVQDAGVKAVLVGESLIKQADLGRGMAGEIARRVKEFMEDWSLSDSAAKVAKAAAAATDAGGSSEQAFTRLIGQFASHS